MNKTEEQFIYEAYNPQELNILLSILKRPTYQNSRTILTATDAVDNSLINHPQQEMGMKPHGLWYAQAHEWLEWIIENDFATDKYSSAYIITPDYSKILKIDSPDKLKSFHEEYSINPLPQLKSSKYDSMYIDWKKIAEKYSGIEIIPYQYKYRFEYMWYCGWDVASGCIWNENAIIKSEQIV